MCHYISVLMCVFTCVFSVIFHRAVFALQEHNQVVPLQIKSVASLWPEICPHPLANTSSSVLNAATQKHTHPYPYRGNCRRLYSDSCCSDVCGQQSNKNQLLPSSSFSPSFSSSSSSSSSSRFLNFPSLLYSQVLLLLSTCLSLFLYQSTSETTTTKTML